MPRLLLLRDTALSARGDGEGGVVAEAVEDRIGHVAVERELVCFALRDARTKLSRGVAPGIDLSIAEAAGMCNAVASAIGLCIGLRNRKEPAVFPFASVRCVFRVVIFTISYQLTIHMLPSVPRNVRASHTLCVLTRSIKDLLRPLLFSTNRLTRSTAVFGDDLVPAFTAPSIKTHAVLRFRGKATTDRPHGIPSAACPRRREEGWERRDAP